MDKKMSRARGRIAAMGGEMNADPTQARRWRGRSFVDRFGVDYIVL